MRGSVLVIGTGISGMSAAGELVQQGFRVCLLEREPEIGGKMAAIDRVLPTMEHTACALQPLMLLLRHNPDVTILTSAELVSFEGCPGDFRVKARYGRREDPGTREEVELAVGAVVVATGLEEARGGSLARFGHGELPNVLTGMELERQLSGLGPTGGAVRLANGGEPRRMAWVVLEKSSPVSFMSTSAQALGLRDKRPDVQVSIIHEPLRAGGPKVEESLLDAAGRGVQVIEASSTEVAAGETGDLILSYKSGDGRKASLETDMLVLSAPLVPGQGIEVLAERLGIEVGDEGFFTRDPASGHPLLSFRPGVFLCGAAAGAQGIGESVIQACAAASHASALLAPARGSKRAETVKSGPRLVKSTDEPKILVVIDPGGPELGELLDHDDLAQSTRSLPGVKRVEIISNASEGSRVKALLATGDFDRLIVAGPSPITHETLFQRHAEAAGLNRHLLEMVNLHNHCARAHSKDKRQATQKAKTLMKMGVVRARWLEPLEEVRVGVTQSGLVVGGGPSGVACASRLAAMGLKVHLVEREHDLGGIPGGDHGLVRPLLAALAASENVDLHTGGMVGRVEGRVGHFNVEVVGPGRRDVLEVGAIVLASRTSMSEPTTGGGFETSLALEKGEDGLYRSTQGILNPLDLTTQGVFSCGSARALLETEESVVDGEAAASRAACVLSSPVLVRPAVISSVVDESCDGCAYCVEPCPTRSITLLEFMHDAQVRKVVEVSDATCIGCGICMATCPKAGIFVRHFKLDCLSEMVKVAQEGPGQGEDHEPVIVCICCNRCAYPATDAAARAGLGHPAGVRIIRQVCAGMVHPNVIMDALTQGADGVLLCGCHPGECRSREGIRKAQARAEAISLLLEDSGLEEERFRLEFIAASEGPKLARVAREMTEVLTALGPNPYRRQP